MNRDAMLERAAEKRPWDLVIVGGGATGVGVAVDAAARGHRTLLLEAADFGQGTSSRSTKLVHGGVRYLQQGNVSLVMEALKERGLMRRNAPHLVHDLRFIVPNYTWWEAPFYGIGLKLYDALAGKYGFGPSKLLSKEKTLAHIPTLRTEGLLGGVQYFDGQFDDARLLIHLVRTADREGATVLNHARVVRLTKTAAGIVDGLVFHDLEGDREIEIKARAVINATGPFSDQLRALDQADAAPMIAPSQGVHLVLDDDFLPGDSAIMVPHTSDGRVMFAIPWHGRTVVGTTDTPIERVSLDPEPFEHEIEFILETAGHYLAKAPTRDDILATFAGIRPLVKAGGDGNTAALSRDHTIHIAPSGLITICGGKWTTYRNMAEDGVNQAQTVAGLDERPCPTRELRIHGYCEDAERFGHLAVHGSDAPKILELQKQHPELAEPLHPRLPYTKAEIVWAAREEMARSVDDCLNRRTRATILDAAAAAEAAPEVERLLADG